VIPTADKARLVELLCATGVDEVEVTSFVSPKWVPQLGDAGELLNLLALSRDEDLALQANPPWKSASPLLSALIPNQRGMDELVRVSASIGKILIDKISVFTAASDTFSQMNTNASIDETLRRFEPVILKAHSLRQKVRGYISCVIACPFEGTVYPAKVAEVSRRLLDLGVDELDLGDTIGAGTPETIARMLEAVDEVWGIEDDSDTPSESATHTQPPPLGRGRVTLHLHDTFGRAAACVKAALDMSVRSFDGSVAGLGGCPYASTPGKRAPGNIDTRLLVETIHAAGYTTNVDVAKLDEAAAFAREIVARSRAGTGGTP
jgi:hydroxymethylglutaryl-CoA lyase